jgi:Matrixin
VTPRIDAETQKESDMIDIALAALLERAPFVVTALPETVIAEVGAESIKYDTASFINRMGRHIDVTADFRLGYSELFDKTKPAWREDSPISFVRFLNQPKYGVLTQVEANTYNYQPKKLGTEVIRYVVQNTDGRKAIVAWIIQIRASEETGQTPADDAGNYAQSSFESQWQTDLPAWQRSTTLSAVLANASQSLTAFADLAATALGETTGEGLSAQITLDTTAAGHSWYIDPTPLDNTDDYLPTSDPTIFKAKAGSAADGKMDMLSVLLHEYSHALGLEHSGNVADFMAASLQSGVRKLPSAAELTLMSQLVAELKNADGEALTLALSQGERGQDNPFAPSPLSALGLLPLGFMRRNGGKGSANAVAGAATAVHTDYLTAINTTLTNGSFSAGQNGSVDQWESIGNVTTAPAAASQAVTLGESNTAQAHLGQAFVLSAQDRFLTFTVSGLDLQTNSIEQNGVFTAAPKDAFEVDLQNANTGANLLNTGDSNLGNCPF